MQAISLVGPHIANNWPKLGTEARSATWTRTGYKLVGGKPSLGFGGRVSLADKVLESTLKQPQQKSILLSPLNNRYLYFDLSSPTILTPCYHTIFFYKCCTELSQPSDVLLSGGALPFSTLTSMDLGRVRLQSGGLRFNSEWSWSGAPIWFWGDCSVEF